MARTKQTARKSTNGMPQRKATDDQMPEMHGVGTATPKEHLVYVTHLHYVWLPLLQKVAEQYPTVDPHVRAEFLRIYEQSTDIETNNFELDALKKQVFGVLRGMQALGLCMDKWDQMQDDPHSTKRRVYDLFVYNMLLHELTTAGKESLSLENWTEFLVKIMKHDSDEDTPTSPLEDAQKVPDSDSEEDDDSDSGGDDDSGNNDCSLLRLPDSDSDEEPASDGGGACAGKKRAFDAMSMNHE